MDPFLTARLGLAFVRGLQADYPDYLPAAAEAVRRGFIAEEVVDRQLGELLRTLFHLGLFNPADRLPVTFYCATEDLPDIQNYDMTNRTYRYFQGYPLYPFGHGLNYTKVRYGELQVTPAPNGALSVTLEVTNAGARVGDEVVQLNAVPPAARERQALCAFGRAPLAGGETKTIRLTVSATALRRWNNPKNRYEIPSGTGTRRAGASSADIRQTASMNH